MRKAAVFTMISIMVLFTGAVFAADVTLFGPLQYTRTTGQPNNFIDTFRGAPGEGRLIVRNGELSSGNNVSNSVSSAKIYVNNEQILGPGDFNKHVHFMEAPISLVENNTIEIELRSKPGSHITVEIIEDIDPPTVVFNAEPASVTFGEESLLSWSCTMADTAVIEPGVGEIDLVGSIPVLISETTFYTLTAAGLGGTTVETISIEYINTPPVADGQSLETDEDTALPVLLAASDVDGDPIVYLPVSGPASGAISGVPPELTYTPAPDFHGQDSFTFIANDGAADSEPAEITVTVHPVNDPPRAEDDVVSTDEDNPALIHVLANDADVDGDLIALAGFTQAASGVVVDNGDGSLTYIPESDFNGRDAFEYTAADGAGGVDTGMVDISVSPVNDPPVANAGEDRTVEREASITIFGLESSDVDGDPLSFSWIVVSSPPVSAAVLSDPSAPTPTFIPDIKGIYEIQLTVHDGALTSEPDMVVITATPRMVPAPELVGLPREEAEAAIVEATLTPGEITSDYNDEAPFGIVIGQTPESSVLVEEGAPVDLVVSLGPDNAPPTVNISASPEVIRAGGSVTLTWSASRAAGCFLEPDIGSVPVVDSIVVSPGRSTTYTITAIGPLGVASANIRVTVLGDPEPPAEGSYGEKYKDLIPPDATLEAYDSWRFTMLTGLVRDMDGQFATDVVIDIFGHPEYGTVRTDSNGRFSIPVEGGGVLTVVYRKEGFITSHREVYAPWNDVAIAETVTLIAEDPAATIVSLDGDPGVATTHRSTEVTDEFGSRSAA
ncbi:MAG: tandem-95 repeat protein, partial [Desulfobacterales bacterium]|nr:tandem-95 repeat protein [Desulfobacterales bacterium]